MGILSNSVSICQFRVTGDRPSADLYDWASERLKNNGFNTIDGTTDEVSSGWVHFDDSNESDFGYPRAFWRDRYIALTLRRDQRRVPSLLFRARLRNREKEFLAAHPGLRRVPKQKREELSEAVRVELFAKTLPAPSTYDAVWDTRSDLVTFTSLSPRALELFENHFKNTFNGLSLLTLHPFSRAQRVGGDQLKEPLLKANRAATGDVLDLIHDNQWLGRDFLLWLTYRTTSHSSEYETNQPGPAQEKEPFVGYLNDRLVLVGDSDGSAQKISIVGSQDHFQEVRTALQNGKEITEATLYLEKKEHQWKMTLRGLTFQFASFRCPSVKIEKDNITDPGDEKEAAFHERMYVLEEGLQLFDSLYAAFLEMRLGNTWSGEEKRIRNWMKSD
jgi:hypothetical protein